jgi:hypothetical protein
MNELMHFAEGKWVCLGHNPNSGVSTWAMRDGEDVVFETRQDASALLDKNRAERNMANNNWKGDYHRIAAIPVSMMYDGYFHEASKEGDEKAVLKFLNDSDNAGLRTKEGRL